VRSGADLGRALAELRTLRGLTQEQVAAQSGVARDYLARIEAGASVAMIERILRVLRRLGARVTVTIELPDDDGR
jgi:transcriptional regulator with XRE-family HTH domain